MDVRLIRVTTHDGGTAALLARRGAWPAARLPVVLVPGFGQNRFSWEVEGHSLPDHLAERGHPVYVLEHRGTGVARGWSDRPAPSLDALVDGDLWAALERIFDDGGGERVALLGHSLGGVTALHFAARHPARVAGIATLSGGFYLARASRLLRALALLLEPLRPLGIARRLGDRMLPLGLAGAMLLAGRWWFDDPGKPTPWPVWQPGSYEPDDLRRRFACGMDRVSVGVAAVVRRAVARDRLVGCEGDERPLLERVRCPVLAIHSATDALVPPEVGAPLVGKLVRSPDARLVVVGRPPDPPLGHCDVVASAEARRSVWPLLGEFLGRLA